MLSYYQNDDDIHYHQEDRFAPSHYCDWQNNGNSKDNGKSHVFFFADTTRGA